MTITRVKKEWIKYELEYYKGTSISYCTFCDCNFKDNYLILREGQLIATVCEDCLKKVKGVTVNRNFKKYEKVSKLEKI